MGLGLMVKRAMWYVSGRSMGPLKVIFCITALMGFFILLRLFRAPKSDWAILDGNFFHDAEDLDTEGGPAKIEQKQDRWIVVTSVQAPTPSIRALAAIPGWRLVVVGDSRTPHGWSVPGVVYLDIAAQEQLKYTITHYLPYNSYSRKMVGYLYAIQNGAEYIYETDDDNIPLDGLQGFHLHNTKMRQYLMVRESNISYNPYSHFGQSSLWPRGFPLEHVARPSTHDYSLCQLRPPSIQQGLSNGDPDVDSIVRMTRTFNDNKLNVHFDEHAPPVLLPRDTFTPYNSQNTLYLYKAFWSLVLPISASFRTCDIHRAYWAQRLLWLQGDYMGYFPPNTFHHRNPHNYVHDAQQETDFLKMGAMLDKLRHWKCERLYFFSCASDLAKSLVSAGFWKNEDVDIMEAWFADLSSVGYAPPTVKNEKFHLCHQKHEDTYHVVFYPKEQPFPLPHSLPEFIYPPTTNSQGIIKFVEDTCKASLSVHRIYVTSKAKPVFPHTLLIVSIDNDGQTIPVLESWYRKNFPQMLYCGKEGQVNRIFLEKLKVSFLGLKDDVSRRICVSMATEMHFNVTGYLYLSEPVLLNTDQLQHRLVNQVWLPRQWLVDDPYTISLCDQGWIQCQEITKSVLADLTSYIARIDAGSKMRSKLKQCMDKLAADPRLYKKIYHLRDIIYYVPQRLTSLFQNIARVFLATNQTARYDIIPILLIQCIEISSEYLEYNSDIQDTFTQNADYTFPYFLHQVFDTESNVHKHFCASLSINSVLPK